MSVPDTAMVMAAGLGKRMRPLTDTRPKPLVEVAGKPLIDHCLDKLRAAGVTKAVVNVHYLADQLQAHLAAVPDMEIAVSDERSLLLETGGGLLKALPMIHADPFLAVNSDNLWTDGAQDTIQRLAAAWDEERMDALLLLVPHERAYSHGGAGDFYCAADGILRRREEDERAPYIYTGIQIVSHRLFHGEMPPGPFSTNILWDRAIEAGRCFGRVHEGLWFDVGAPENIKVAEEVLGRL